MNTYSDEFDDSIHKQMLDELKNIKWYIKWAFWYAVIIILLGLIMLIINMVINLIRR